MDPVNPSPSAESLSSGSGAPRRDVRTLPTPAAGTGVAAPQIDRKDRLWTEIDVLDDVKRMAAMDAAERGFPDDFEARLQRLRRSQAALLDATRMPAPDLDAQRQRVLDIMRKLESLRDLEEDT
ncbi:AaceriAEL248Cp [[Ashbya] aceris (nom. inval.)]|nr:AaceriAEL248Cp [[Ashbya] aceris (nom. inval.)]